MARKNVGGKKKSKDVALNKDNRGESKRGHVAEDDKEKSNPGGSSRVLRSRKANEGEGNAGERSKGRKPMLKKGNLTIHDGAEKDENAGKGKVTTEEENAETARTPAKGNRNAGGNEKGKSILSGSDRILRPHSARQGDRIIDEKAKGKRKLVAEEGNAEKPKLLTKKRNTDKEIAESSMSSGPKSLYNLRSKKVVPSSWSVGLSESGSQKKEDDGGDVEDVTLASLKKGGVKSPVQKRSNTKSQKGNTEKKVGNAKTRALQKTKKDGGQLNEENRKNPARKGRSNTETKK